jgi:succinate dehydrogenase/fumarate reductase flavoprotein subunit
MRFDPITAMNKGLDPRFDIIETCPAAHTTIGGIRINDECATNTTGLYAAGSVAGGIYGLARPEGYTSMITLVFGRRAGLFAAEYSKQSKLQKIDAKLLNPYIEKTTSIIDNENGASVNKVRSEIRNTLTEFGWVIKDEEGLSRGINQIRRIRNKYPSFNITNGRDWLNALELGNMLLTAELLLLGSIQRKESRGAFFRDDYPNPDNSNWMHNIIYTQADSKPILTKHDPSIN